MNRSVVFKGMGQCTASLYPQGVASELERMRARAIESGETVSARVHYLKVDGYVSTAYKYVDVFVDPDGSATLHGTGLVRRLLDECI